MLDEPTAFELRVMRAWPPILNMKSLNQFAHWFEAQGYAEARERGFNVVDLWLRVVMIYDRVVRAR